MNLNLLSGKSMSSLSGAITRNAVALLLLLLLTTVSSVTFAKIRYASFDAWTGDHGNAWNHASGDLQAMIDASQSGDQVWVRAGTFEITSPLVMKTGVLVYGGFEGVEKELYERIDWLQTHPGNKSIIKRVGNGHVIRISHVKNALLDGFTVTGGSGVGGIVCDDSAVTISNCIISGNKSDLAGGGIYNFMGSNMWLVGCVVSGNSAQVGGGIYNFSDSKMSVYHCTISGNTGLNSAIGLYSDTPLLVRNTIIYGNRIAAVPGNPLPAEKGDVNKHDVQYSLVTGWTGTGNGNLSGSVNPLFLDGGIAIGFGEATNTGDYRLQPCSPSRNVGSNEAYLEMTGKNNLVSHRDMSGWPRVAGFRADMGAYEERTQDHPSFNGIIFVKPGAGGTGESWACPMGDLQQAIYLASVGKNQIWVASGTYVPNYPANNVIGEYNQLNRDNAFLLKDGVKVYGGFAGTETSLSGRLISSDRPSILSGDLKGDDGSGNYGDNAYHVVVLAGGLAHLDGFTISGGNANGQGSLNSALVVNGIAVERNRGGGMSLYSDATSLFSNLIIAGNNAQHGGGVALRGPEPLTMTGSVISGNTANVQGGGMYIDAIAPMLTNMTITANAAPTGGGITMDFVKSFQTFRNSIIYGNAGGSVLMGSESTGFQPQFSLIQDLTTSDGHNIPGSVDPMFKNPLPPGLSTGGDYSLLICSPLVNKGNSASHDPTSRDLAGNLRIFAAIDVGAYEFNGTPLKANGYIDADLVTCSGSIVPLTFVTNSGAGPFTLIINDVTYPNVYSGVPFDSESAITSTTTFTLSSIAAPGNCINADYVSSVTVTIGSYQASLTGSGICAGDNGRLTLNATDSSGPLTAVINGITYDSLTTGVPFEVGNTIGEYILSDVIWNNGCTRTENFTQNAASVVIRQPIVHYVMQGATGDGLSWATASGDLQDVLNKVCLADTVFVAGGTYKPSGLPDFISTTDQRDFAFLLINGVQLYGGFAGTETHISQRVRGNVTTLSGNIDNNDDLGDDSYHVVLSVGDNANAVFDGFTVTGGNAYGDGSLSVGSQAVSRSDGGGMSVIGHAPKISNVNFNSNIARRGGGLSVEAGNASISNANFTNNKTYGDVGGGVFLDGGSNSVFTNCVFADNIAEGRGGGISAYAATLTLRNCIVRNNLAEEGGGMFMLISTADVINSTVTANDNFKQIGGVYALNTTFRARNSIFWRNNTEEIVVEIEPNASGVDEVRYSLVDGGYPSGTDIVNADPGFVNASNPAGPDGIWRTADDGLRIYCDGPAAESGSGETPEFDILGIKRANRPDMGAYEAFVRNITGTDASLIMDQEPNTVVVYADCVNQIATIDGDGYNLSGEVMAKVWVEDSQPVQYLKRHYQITPVENPQTATAKLTLYFTQQDFTDFNNQIPAPEFKLPLNAEDVENYKTYLRVEKRGGAGDENGTPGSYSGTLVTINPYEANGKVEWNAGADRWEVSFEVTGFSGFFIKTTELSLPLHLISFTARKEEGSNLLQWSTASEVNTDNFEIQVSSDAKSFGKIAMIIAGGSGDNQYSYLDYKTYSGIIYYRLKMSDLDQTFTYSKIISLRSDGSSNAVYPNPAGAAVTFRVSNALLKSTANLYDLSGRKLQTIVITTNQQQISTGSLVSGLYVLKFADGTAERFVKE